MEEKKQTRVIQELEDIRISKLMTEDVKKGDIKVSKLMPSKKSKTD